MHELSIALRILDIAAEEADRRGGARCVAVHLQLGPLAGVVKEALLSAYELARENSDFASTELVIEDVPLVAWCSACDAERTLASIQCFECDVCGTPISRIVRGRELEMTALELAE